MNVRRQRDIAISLRDLGADFAHKLGITGTPSWVVGDQLIIGAVGREALAKALAAARGK